MKKYTLTLIVAIAILSQAIAQQDIFNNSTFNPAEMKELPNEKYQQWVGEYIKVPLTSDLKNLSEADRSILPLLFEVANIMDDIYWLQAYGNKTRLMKHIQSEDAKRLVEINYGPWNRLHGNMPIFENIGQKPAGANFYPPDMTKEEFEAYDNPEKKSLYTVLRRNKSGTLRTILYHEFYGEQVNKASRLMVAASEVTSDPGFADYLRLRAQALLNDDYFESDMAWMSMKTNTIDFVVGPIENYEDQLYSYKAAHEAFILIKDMEWSERLAHYSALLPDLQMQLPVDEKYKQEVPGSDSDLGVYDAIYYKGDCNAGSKTIAINLPNDSKVQLAKGSRRLQLKNAMRAKFENILMPISNMLIDPSQQTHVTFNAFFENTMFHEVAHGLGIKNTINGKGDVRTSLKEQYSAIEEGKADILGLFLVTKLKEMGELEVDLMDNYVTFMAGIFRSIRFGASSAHGRANLMRFYYFKEMGAFQKTDEGFYKIDFEKMKDAMNSLTDVILTLQGNGDYDGVKKLMEEKGKIGPQLQKDLDRLKESNIPVDVIFDQGVNVVGIR
ncbi:MAG: Zn-dependent hydrolase [Bacteroidales bacterium]|nr:Zn-dependent hydrolase [Bacteroidales bacterium]MCF8456617.1 Zn-dependent hydrolase [Bacteroidales bacterium]